MDSADFYLPAFQHRARRLVFEVEDAISRAVMDGQVLPMRMVRFHERESLRVANLLRSLMKHGRSTAWSWCTQRVFIASFLPSPAL